MYLISKVDTFAKLFFIISFCGLFAYIVLAFYTFHTTYIQRAQVTRIQNRIKHFPDPNLKPLKIYINNDLKYILLWTKTSNENELKWEINEEGQAPFVKYNCSYTNCFLTTNKELLDEDYRNYDAIVFDVSIIKRWRTQDLPRIRTRQQKYIFHSSQSAADLPVCDADAEDFFNWTWTYKLSSDIFKRYFEVKDMQGNIVAPGLNVKWLMNMTYLSHANTTRMKTKKKALAWVIHKCGTRESRLQFTKELQFAMAKSNLILDIYGCEHLKCPEGGCMKAIEKDYYFYLVYEDSFAEDYLSDEVLKAYNNWAVPIIISGASLEKFLPSNSYIDARFTTPDKLAAIMDYTLREIHLYYGYHRWRNHYSFHQVSDQLRGICQICNHLNNPVMVNTESTYRSFRKWWYADFKKRCLPKPTDVYNIRPYPNNTRLTTNISVKQSGMIVS